MEKTEIIAALGPTNTGKTHRAIERMLEHESGMIGLPLRLLAREIYEKIVRLTSSEEVALITGEEKRLPASPRYFVCTVEAMPLHRQVDFLAVDEIQLAGHFERGHVFTDRLLNARGRKETWFMGAETMAPLIRRLVPTAQIRRAPRLSTLRAEGVFTLGTLPPRSAVVAFSAAQVYEIAEKLRARKGGAALVLGALSPRARNAQVELYESGEVDYLVATDAIGMGLNLSLDHVAFAGISKFDGSESRQLEDSELGQIAGRAGRHTKDGGFGTFQRDRLPQRTEFAIEHHRYPTQKVLTWRRSEIELDFSSSKDLLASLHESPRDAALRLVTDAEDTRALNFLISQTDIKGRTQTPEDLKLLWRVCQIPDYRKLLVDEHGRLLTSIYLELRERGSLPETFLEPRLKRLEVPPEDIDSLMTRLAFVRTWSYVASQGDWVDPRLQAPSRTRDLEDKLSTALHEMLVERFVKKRRRPIRTLDPNSKRKVSAPLPSPTGDTFQEQLAAMKAALEGDSTEDASHLVSRIIEEETDSFDVDERGRLLFEGVECGRLRRGRTVLEPEVALHPEYREGESGRLLTERLRKVARKYCEHAIGGFLWELRAEIAEDDSRFSAAFRGCIYQLSHGLGCTDRADLAPLLPELSPSERKRLESQGLQLNAHSAYFKASLKQQALRKRSVLVSTHMSWPDLLSQLDKSAQGLPPLTLGASFFERCGRVAETDWLRLGYRVLGNCAIRVDLAERVSEVLRNEPSKRKPGLIASLLGIRRAHAAKLLGSLRAQRSAHAH